MKENGIKVVGAMPKSRWNGKVIREQDFVLGIDGISMSIPASYWKHPFKVIEIKYEKDRH
jgi:hypothetical protein